MKELELRAAEELSSLLEQVPALRFLSTEREVPLAGSHVDFVTYVKAGERRRHALECEAKGNGQPRQVSAALLQLRKAAADVGSGDATPIFIAPYMSPEARSLCQEHNVGYLDFEGNARIVFEGIFIERTVASKPQTEKRELRSLFKPKSAQVLRVMLRNPGRAWRVTDLAVEAGVSLGHVSNVRSALLNRGWAEVSDEGVYVAKPDALLDAWRDAYESPVEQRLAFYTTLHGTRLDDLARKTLRALPPKAQAAFASFSAALWLAPYARTGVHYFYANHEGVEALQRALSLSVAPKGENIMIMVPHDAGPLLDTVMPVPDAICTSAVQTYLDLWNAGERGREAAAHLRQKVLQWQ